MRDATISLATLLFLSSTATAASSSGPECINTHSRELAARASCGDEGSLNHCFSSQVSVDSTTSAEQLTSELERCFQNAGCTVAESQIEALWTLQRCSSGSIDVDDSSDLRRRRAGAIPLPRGPAPIPGITIIAARQDAPSPTVPAPNPASPSPCFVETDIEITSCPVQTTGPQAGKKLPCFETTVPSQVCAPNLICQVDFQGNPSCMVRQSSLGVAGTIIAIFFAAAVACAIFTVCFLCCRERKSQRRLMRAAEAAKIAQEAKTQALINAKKNATSVADDVALDRQPLMSKGGAGAGADAGNPSSLPNMTQQYGAGANTGYGGSGGQNPFADANDSHPMR